MNTKQWQAYSFLFQMGNIGSEISRATMFKEQYNERSRQSFEIALDLLDLTIKDPKNVGRLAELCRLREVAVDYFYADNQYQSKAQEWNDYFQPFAYAAAVERGL